MRLRNKLFKETNTITLRPTSQPTGVLGNLFSDEWFLAIEQGNPDATPEKKVLVFADPMYEKRSKVSKALIIKKLRDLHKEGFTILNPQGDDFIEWHSNSDPVGDTLNSIHFVSSEELNRSLRTQRKLNANDTCILTHYFINTFVPGLSENAIDWHLFKTTPHNLTKMIKATPFNSYTLKLNSTTAEDIQAFIDFIETENILKNNVNHIHLIFSEITMIQLQKLLTYFPNIKGLFLKSCKLLNSAEEAKLPAEQSAAESLAQLKPNSLPFLEALSLNDTPVIAEVLPAWLLAAPKLQLLNMEMMSLPKKIGFPTSLQTELIMLVISSCTITSEILTDLCNISEKLKSINFTDLWLQDEAMLKLNKNALQQLEKIFITGANIPTNQLIDMLNQASNLDMLSMTQCEMLKEAAFIHFPLLKKVDTVSLQYCPVDVNNLVALLQATPNITRLRLDQANINGKLSTDHMLDLLYLPKLTQLNFDKMTTHGNTLNH